MQEQLNSLTTGRGKAELHPLAPISVLHEYAKLGAVQRAHLVGVRAPEMLSNIAVAKLGTYSPPRLDSFGAVGYALHSSLSLIVRGTVRCAHVSPVLCSHMRLRSRARAAFTGRPVLLSTARRVDAQPVRAAWRPGRASAQQDAVPGMVPPVLREVPAAARGGGVCDARRA
jgi:hypothetical protein